MMFLFVILVARSAPASEDGVQLGGMKRPCVLTIRIAPEAAETSGEVEEPARRQAATRLADGERRDERAVRCRVLLHQALQGFRHLVDGMGWQDLKSLRQLLVGNGNLALREVLEECAYPCMRWQPIVLSQSSALSRSGMSPARANDPDRPRLLHDDPIALSISAPHPVAARLVVGPDDVGDVGVGDERYDAVAPSGNGVGSEVDGGHSKSSPGPGFRLRASVLTA